MESIVKWISVEDESVKPYNEMVFIYFQDGEVDIYNGRHLFSDVTAGLNNDGSHRYVKRHTIVGPGVTHWAYIPDISEEEWKDVSKETPPNEDNSIIMKDKNGENEMYHIQDVFYKNEPPKEGKWCSLPTNKPNF